MVELADTGGEGAEGMEEGGGESVELEVGVVGRWEGRPLGQVSREVEESLWACGASTVGPGRPVERPQAPYEEREVELRFRLVWPAKDVHWALAELAEAWCDQSSTRRLFPVHRTSLLRSLTPFHKQLNVQSMSFGAFLSPARFVRHWSHYSLNDGRGQFSVWADFDHYKRTLSVMVQTSPGEGFKFQLSYQGVHSILVDTNSVDMNEETGAVEPTETVFFVLRHPLQLWRKLAPKARGQRTTALWHFKDYVRVTSCPQIGLLREVVGASCVFSLSFPKAHMQQFNGLAPSKELELPVLFQILSRMELRSRLTPSYVCVEELDSEAVFGREAPVALPRLEHFPSAYALQSLVSRGYAVTDQLKRKLAGDGSAEALFGRAVSAAAQRNPYATQRALEQLCSAVDERRSVVLTKAFDFLFHLQLEGRAEEPVDVPLGCCTVPKVLVTPSRVLFLAPQVMLCNRVVREFGQEFALRLNFRDDDGRKLQNNLLGMRDEGREVLRRMVRKALLEGVEVAGRLFRFLAWSNSQLRDHGCYLYADQRRGDAVLGVADIRRWMGDFTAITSVPKLMSRMGQCFTQAQIADAHLPDECFQVEEDIMGGELHPETLEPYNFTDGVGRVSKAYANKLATNLKLDYLPCAFQIRFKGCKGMLVLDPYLDAGPGVEAVFRQSMAKFTSDGSSALEVVKYGMPSPVCFNRPLIMIMDQVGEKQGGEAGRRMTARVEALMEEELLSMADMLWCEAEAVQALHDRLNLAVDFRQLGRFGFQLSAEPFARRLLLALHRYTIKEKLAKAKMEVHPSLGRTLYGVVDESGLLQYGQVFIRVSSYLSRPNHKPRLITGQVLVTKNPCIVPGDVRVFEAVELEALEHLCDVIVFPRHGPRPHPDEMAGSDLDGDEYSVFWDPQLLFRSNEAAMTFPKAKAPDLAAGARPEHMVHFFLTYMTQDAIGKISNAHLAAADRLGIFSELCMEIGRKCSMAVDFPKTGIPADELTTEERSRVFPDYFAKDHNPCYRSRRLLGRLFRKSRVVDEMLELGGGTSAAAASVRPDPDLLHPDLGQSPAVRAAARKTLQHYAAQLQNLLDNYGVLDEASLVSGQMLTLRNRVTDMDKEDYSFYNTEKLVELRFARLSASTRRRFFAEFGGEPEDVGEADEAMLVKASAWYEAAYAADDPRLAFLSFPWTVWELLAQLKRGATFRRPADELRNDTFPARLVAALDDHLDAHADAVAALVHHIKALDPIFDAYFTRYTFLAALFFVLKEWAEREGALEALRPEHLAFLLISFATGHHRPASNTTKAPRSEETQQDLAERGGDAEYVVQTVDSPEEAQVLNEEDGRAAQEGLPLQASHGTLLLRFLAYLSTESFKRLEALSFPSLGVPGQLDRKEWVRLHLLAFKTYHRVALSGTWECMLGGEAAGEAEGAAEAVWDWDESETMPVELPLPGMWAWADSEVGRQLAEWSGCDEVCLVREPRAQEVARVLYAGGLQARHRLRAILLHPGLVHALKSHSPTPPIPADLIED